MLPAWGQWLGALALAVVGAGCDTLLGLTPPPPADATTTTSTSPWVSVGVGWDHACGVRADGTLWCWGDNSDSESASAGSNEVDQPTRVGSSTSWVSVVGGNDHTCGLQSDHSLWCWGLDQDGQDGFPISIQVTPIAPSPVEVGGTWQSVTIGDDHSCGIKSDGSLWCWGLNNDGQVGVGQAQLGVDFPSPQPVTGAGLPSQWKKACVSGDSGSYGHSCAIASNGGLWCWGDDTFQELGTSSPTAPVPAPVQVGSDTGWFDLACGELFNCGLHTVASGAEWDCWGAVPGISEQSVPTMVAVGPWTALRGGPYDTCALDANNALWCIGVNTHGELGAPAIDDVLAPTMITGGAGAWSDVALGVGVACALGMDRTLWCAGVDGVGQLGDGGGSPSAPLQVGSGSSWTNVSAGQAQMCALTSTGQVACAGDNTYEALGTSGGGARASLGAPAGLGSATAVAVGVEAACAIVDTLLYCWGDDDVGATGSTNGGSNTPQMVVNMGAAWTDTLALSYHGCAGQGDSTVWCWGFNSFEQCGLSAATSPIDPPMQAATTMPIGWAQVAVGQFHTCALDTNGSAWCWGVGAVGQLGNGSANMSSPTATPVAVTTDLTFTSIAAGSNDSCAIATDKTGWCWGSGGDGELGDGGATNLATPIAITGDISWAQLAPGTYHTCGIATNGALWCWGDNSRGELGNGTHDGHATPMQVGSDTHWAQAATGDYFSCAVKSDQSLWCWGANDSGQLAYAKGFSETLIQVP